MFALLRSKPAKAVLLAGAGLMVFSTLVAQAAGVSSRSRTLDGPAGRLFVDDGGPRLDQGQLPVLFVHSFAGNTSHWQPALQHLRLTRRAVAMDFRGHGRSTAPRANSAYATADLAADIAAVADGLALRRFVLVGHSMGGSAAVAYASAHPERVAALVLVATPGKAPQEMSSKVMDSLRADYDKTMAGYWDSLLKGARPPVRRGREAEQHRIGREASMAMIEATFAYDPLPALAAYAGPELIIDTEHAAGAAALHSQAPQIERRVVSGTSHWPQLDDPPAFARLLDEFLSRVQ